MYEVLARTLNDVGLDDRYKALCEKAGKQARNQSIERDYKVYTWTITGHQAAVDLRERLIQVPNVSAVVRRLG